MLKRFLIIIFLILIVLIVMLLVFTNLEDKEINTSKAVFVSSENIYSQFGNN